MKVIIIDCGRFTSKESAHEYIAKQLEFPGYYGKNLDALFDCLSELAREKAVILTNTDPAKKQLGSYADSLFGVFAEVLEKHFRVIMM